MSGERELREANPILQASLKKVLKSLEEYPWQDPELSDANDMVDLMSDGFSNLARTAIVAEKLGYQTGYWRGQVEAYRQSTKKELVASHELIAAIEIDEEYCNYLIRVGEVDLAIATAQQITDGYSFPTPPSENKSPTNRKNNPQEFSFDQQRQRSISKVAFTLARLGLVEEAGFLMQSVDEIRYGDAYYQGLLDYYQLTGDKDGLYVLETQVVNSWQQEYSSEDERRTDHTRLELLEDIETTYTELLFLDLDDDGTLKGDNRVSSFKLEAAVGRVYDLLDRNALTQAKALAVSILELSGTVTDPYLGLDLEEYSPAEIDQIKHDQLTNVLLRLGMTLSGRPETHRLAIDCIENSYERSGLQDAILRANPHDQPDKWMEMMSIYANVGDHDSLDRIYDHGVRIFRSHVDQLTFHYDRISREAWNNRHAIVANEMSSLVPHVYADLIMASARFGKLRDWKSMVGELAFESDSFDGQSQSSNVLTDTLSSLAELALEKRELQVFLDIMADPRWSMSSKTRVLKHAAERH